MPSMPGLEEAAKIVFAKKPLDELFTGPFMKAVRMGPLASRH
jgi:hypothetical protein